MYTLFKQTPVNVNCCFLFFLFRFWKFIGQIFWYNITGCSTTPTSSNPMPTDILRCKRFLVEGWYLGKFIHSTYYNSAVWCQFEAETFWVQFRSVSWVFCQFGCISAVELSLCALIVGISLWFCLLQISTYVMALILEFASPI
jgi:hypothetical protein